MPPTRDAAANVPGGTLTLLAPRAEHEARLLAELDAWGRDRLPTLQDLEAGALPFAQAVLNESLRMYPAGSTAVREGNNGMKLGGYSIPDLSAVQVGFIASVSTCSAPPFVLYKCICTMLLTSPPFKN